MKVQIYILGFLIRKGPLHGYGLKQLISEEVSDFTNIKLPTIYYHLDRMEKKGLIKSNRKTDSNRPERFVYTIKGEGKKQFYKMIKNVLNKSKYRTEFLFDAIFFFYNFLEETEILRALERSEKDMTSSLNNIIAHRKNIIKYIPEKHRKYVDSIFMHHQYHYDAELKWIKDVKKKW